VKTPCIVCTWTRKELHGILINIKSNPMATSQHFHHHTACSYLKQFSEEKEKGRKAKIYRYDKVKGKGEYFLVDHVGAENNSYTIEVEGKKSDILETSFFNKIDYHYPKLIKKFESQMPIESFKEEISLIFSTQFARVPAQRDILMKSEESYNAQRKKIGVPEEKLDPVNNNALNKFMLVEMSFVHSCLDRYFFKVFISNTDKFITCDNPADTSCLPLSSDMCLVMSSIKELQDYSSADSSTVEIINKITFDKAKRWVYAESEDTLLESIA